MVSTDFTVGVMVYSISDVNFQERLRLRFMALILANLTAISFQTISPTCSLTMDEAAQPVYKASTAGYNGNIAVTGKQQEKRQSNRCYALPAHRT